MFDKFFKNEEDATKKSAENMQSIPCLKITILGSMFTGKT